MPDLPIALSALPAQAIHAHFATRPALFSVVFKALRAGIREHYPSLKVDVLTLKLAGPTPCGANTCYAFPLLISVALAHVLNPRLLDLRPRTTCRTICHPLPAAAWPISTCR
ncbi:hypothetical protein [Pseudomonas poae]|uniref:hypothetical protein n=1 Tax=Pseudomonas poae TaxID=200451 RepID=UPI001E3B0D3B|nr:hypothetical protein [Pseudomonas poae]